MSWSPDVMPDLTGRRAVVTGVTGGLGVHTAMGLARRGADLVVTARDDAKGAESVALITKDSPGATVDVVALDLADLADATRAATEVAATYDRVDILINNAGIMLTPERTTADGFELQIGTNHLGHFAWTATLWPLLRASEARVVHVSSMAHTSARGIDLSSLTPAGSPRPYKSWQSYAESKLANLMFTLELDRRVKAAGLGVVSVAAHPGLASTSLTKTGPTIGGNSLRATGMHQIVRIIGQSAEMGSWPTLRAATDTTLTGGEYLGPSGFRQSRGRPRLVGMTDIARDRHLAAELWSASEAATGTPFAV